jgi:hypothetical protein
MTFPQSPSGSIAGSVLPIRRAEELIATLPGVLSVRIVPNDHGSIDEIHVLTTNLVQPKQTVRNIESALIAQLGWRVNHRKISIATTLDPLRAADAPPVADAPQSAPQSAPPLTAQPGGAAQLLYGAQPGTQAGGQAAGGQAAGVATPAGGVHSHPSPAGGGAPPGHGTLAGAQSSLSRGVVRGASAVPETAVRRTLLFEDVEVRRSRTKGVLCRVTLSRDGTEYYGEAEGPDSERSRVELASRAAVQAIIEAARVAAGGERALSLEGAKLISAFEREFIFVSVAARVGRDAMVLTGTCEIRDSAETSAVLAVLDATNRWMNLDR